MFMQQAVRVIQRYSTSAQDVNDLPSWLVTSWEVDIERKKIGAGGFGKVYPAKWHGTKVAIKELDSQTSPEVCFPCDLPRGLKLDAQCSAFETGNRYLEQTPSPARTSYVV